MHEVILAGVKPIETRQTVIVLVASAYNGQGSTDPAPYAKQIRESGVKLLTVAFVRINEGDQEVQKVADLASPGFSFNTKKDGSNLDELIQQAFCRGKNTLCLEGNGSRLANCFCPNGWIQVSDDFQKPTTKYAECVRLSSSSSNWFGGSMACSNDVNGNAFLASERSDAKHKFHADYLRKVYGKVKPYFIGLSWDDASQQYLWSEKFDNGTQIPLDPSIYQSWASGNGNHKQANDGVQVVPRGFDTYWYDVDQYGPDGAYVCQANACDTDNYCDDSVDDDQ
ncbi:Protein CLEC-62 b [Aphelenchoides avenae]|nr:Protein CLEC-62 b [Aphelenchus avenae]